MEQFEDNSCLIKTEHFAKTSLPVISVNLGGATTLSIVIKEFLVFKIFSVPRHQSINYCAHVEGETIGKSQDNPLH
jgi:hypothetical protein